MVFCLLAIMKSLRYYLGGVFEIMEDKTYIVVLNYNDYKDTIACLTSLYNLKYSHFQVIVCDNHSKGDDVQRILAWQHGEDVINMQNPFGESTCVRPRQVVTHHIMNTGTFKNQEQVKNDPDDALIILQADCNRGYSAGNNMGIHYAQLRDDYKYIWILNNDTVVDSNALQEMINTQKQEKAAGVGSVIRYYNKPELIQLVGSTTNWEDMCIDMVFDDTDIKELTPGVMIENLPGPSFVLTKEFVDKINCLNEAYFIYCEEPDLGIRARQLGEKFTYAVKSYTYHKGGCTTCQHGSGFRDYHQARSWTILLNNYAPDAFPKFRKKANQTIKKRMKHLHMIRAYSVFKGIRDGLNR